MQKQATINGLK